MIDAADVERRSGWRVVAFDVVGSTNDELSRLRDAGHAPRVVVVADRQREGRGRGGHRFESPPGGLYASLLVEARAADLPGPVTAAVALALRDVVAACVGGSVAIKWPNDLWIHRRKVAGILTEASLAGASPSARVGVVVGIGVNVDGVPATLSPDVAAETTALSAHAPTPVRREDLLVALLLAVDTRLHALESAPARAELAAAYRNHLALLGERVHFLVGEAPQVGTFLEASLEQGLYVRDDAGTGRWWSSSLVRELRPGLR